MEIPLLYDLVLMLALSIGVIFIFNKLKLPTILGFLATGMAFGPSALGLIEASHEIEILSEIGVILLLFIIGLEFSLSSLARIKKVVFIGGTTQVLLTIGAVYLVTRVLDFPPGEAVFFGFLIALSSTAIVLKTLQQQGMMNSPHGKVALGVLIFQDIIVVPMMLLTPMLAGESANLWVELGLLLAKASAVIVAVLVLARYVVPRLLHAIVDTRNRELFIISIVVICFAVAWATSRLGLSLALGAFMAGLTISESQYSHQATSLIIPFREIFSAFFFISIGMLLDVGFFFGHIFPVVGLALLIFVLKFFILFFSTRLLQYPSRTALLSGFTLFQVGEFAFILARTGMEFELLANEPYQYFLSVSILTMAVTPFAIAGSEKMVTTILPKASLESEARLNGGEEVKDHTANLEDHLLIIGYGPNGQNLAAIAQKAKIPYAILDVNKDNVALGRKEDHPIFFGDASNPYMLEQMHIWKARVAVVAISDPAATHKITASIRDICNTVYIVARCRFLSETDELMKLGASEVIAEEFEASMEIFSRVLNQYLVPESEIGEYVQNVRNHNYKMMRPFFKSSDRLGLPEWSDLRVSALRIETDNNHILDKPLSEINLPESYGINLMAIYRDNEIRKVVEPEAKLQKGDLVYVFGSPQAINDFGKDVHA